MTQNKYQKQWLRWNHANSFSQFLFPPNIKRKKDAILPKQSLLCACAGLSRDIFQREKNNGLKIAPNFTSICGTGWYSYRSFLSSENAIHLYLHIFTMQFCILYWLFHVCDLRKPVLEYIEKIEVNYKTTNSLLFVCMQRFLVLSEYRVGFFNLFINSIKAEI